MTEHVIVDGGEVCTWSRSYPWYAELAMILSSLFVNQPLIYFIFCIDIGAIIAFLTKQKNDMNGNSTTRADFVKIIVKTVIIGVVVGVASTMLAHQFS